MTLKQFEKQQYLNIETFRKNGQGVKTPVWFVQDGEALQVWTQAGSGKAKRIRNNGTVRVAPSTGSGEPTGEWVDARAETNESPDAIIHVEKIWCNVLYFWLRRKNARRRKLHRHQNSAIKQKKSQ